MAIQLLISAGRKTRDLSFMTSSKSVSRNSRTRLRFFLDEKTSRSCSFEHVTVEESVGGTYFYDVLVLQFAQELDLTDGGHVETVLELSYFDFLDSDLSAGG